MGMWTVEDMKAHAGPLVEGRLEERVLEALPQYMWMYGSGKKKSGICTHCHRVLEGRDQMALPDYAGNDVEAWMQANPVFIKSTGERIRLDCGEVDGQPIHLHGGYCNRCGHPVQFRDLGRSRKYLSDRMEYVDIRKSRVNPDVLVMVGCCVDARWNKDLHEWMSAACFAPDLVILPQWVMVLEWGKTPRVMTWRGMSEWIVEEGKFRYWYEWKMVKQVRAFPGRTWGYGYSCPSVYCVEDLECAMQGTNFSRLFGDRDVWTVCPVVEMPQTLMRACKYPAVEYLWKLGLKGLAKGVLDNSSLVMERLSLRKKKANEVLRISPEQWAWVKGNKRNLSFELLRMMQTANKYRARIGCEALESYAVFHSAERFEELCKAFARHGLVKKAVSYLTRRRDISSWDYRDHLRMMGDLGIPMTDGQVAFPADFQEMHGRIAKQVTVVQRASEQVKLEAFLETLGDCRFSAYGLVLAPLATVGDVVQEGLLQKHCMGTYVGRYAEGKTILCTLREESDMGTPLYSVELTLKRTLVQCRGKGNKDVPGYEERVRMFWRLFSLMQADRLAQMKKQKKRPCAA